MRGDGFDNLDPTKVSSFSFAHASPSRRIDRNLVPYDFSEYPARYARERIAQLLHENPWLEEGLFSELIKTLKTRIEKQELLAKQWYTFINLVIVFALYCDTHSLTVVAAKGNFSSAQIDSIKLQLRLLINFPPPVTASKLFFSTKLVEFELAQQRLLGKRAEQRLEEQRLVHEKIRQEEAAQLKRMQSIQLQPTIKNALPATVELVLKDYEKQTTFEHGGICAFLTVTKTADRLCIKSLNTIIKTDSAFLPDSKKSKALIDAINQYVCNINNRKNILFGIFRKHGLAENDNVEMKTRPDLAAPLVSNRENLSL